MSTQDELSEIQFAATTTNILTLYSLISSILPFGKDCLLTITQDGICFSIQDNNVCKVLLNLDRKVFRDYLFNPAPLENEDEHERTDVSNRSITVHLDLKSFIETINIHIPSNEMRDYDSKVKCILSYKSDGYPFVLTFEDDLMIERSELLTLYLDEEDDSNANEGLFQIDHNEVVFDIVLNSSLLYDVLKDMNDLRTKELIIYCAKESQNTNNTKVNNRNTLNNKDTKLVFLSRSENESIGYSKIVVPNNKQFLKDLQLFKPVFKEPNNADTDIEDDDDDDDVLENSARERVAMADVIMEAAQDINISSFYNFFYFSKILKSIKLSNSVKIRKDLHGITSVSMILDSLSVIGNKPNYKSESSRFSDTDMNTNTHNTITEQERKKGRNFYLGSSIEFITLESIPLEERYTDANGNDEQVTQLGQNDSNLQVYGYFNKAIDKLIRDDENIKIIKVTGSGQITTLDDFYQQVPRAHRDTNRNDANLNLYPEAPAEGIEEVPVSINAIMGNDPISNQLETLMEFNNRFGSHLHTADNNNTATGSGVGPVATTTTGSSDDHDNTNDTRKRRKSNLANDKKGKKGINKKGGKGKGSGGDEIQTVGGAIEIPLFI